MACQAVCLHEAVPQLDDHGKDLIYGCVLLAEIGLHCTAKKIIVQCAEPTGYLVLMIQCRIQMPEDLLRPLQGLIGLCVILLAIVLLECAELLDQLIKQADQHFTRGHGHNGLLLVFLIWIERHTFHLSAVTWN